MPACMTQCNATVQKEYIQNPHTENTNDLWELKSTPLQLPTSDSHSYVLASVYAESYSPSLRIGTMSGFICARYTIAHLIKQIKNQSKHKKKKKWNEKGYGYSPVRNAIEPKENVIILNDQSLSPQGRHIWIYGNYSPYIIHKSDRTIEDFGIWTTLHPQENVI